MKSLHDRAPQAIPRFGGEGFYGHVARGYDRTASTYDEVEGRNLLSERVRAIALSSALRVFQEGDRILELGCGTGRDAVTLAQHGIEVVATDLSPDMVGVTRTRAEAAGVGDRVTTRVLSAADAAAMDGPFDGAYSNGAVLNLEPGLERVAQGLARTLRPGAHAVVTALNRLSLFELLVYPVALRPRKAFRKLGSSVPIPISREGVGSRYVVPTRFLTPPEFFQMFARGFDAADLRGLQIFTPPWNFVDLAGRFRTVVGPLQRIEDTVGPWPGLRNMGAIYLYDLRRKEG